MGERFTRRQVLAATSAGALAAALPRAVLPQPAGLVAEALAPDILLVTGAGANVVALNTEEGILLVDGGLEAHAEQLLELLAERWPEQRVAILFNTNWRDEHIGANPAANAAGARILAHENTKLWIGGDFAVEWEQRHHSPRPAAYWPNHTFYKSGSLELRGRRVEYWHLPRAHTDGDIAVYFPDHDVLVAGDLVSVGRYPVPDYATGGWIGGLLAATTSLRDRTSARTRIVPAVGAPCGRPELEAQLALCTSMRDKTAAAFRAGMSLKDFAASKPTAEFDAAWGDPTQFLSLVYKGGFAHLRELGGVI
jgi:glyoxylase-like metal-dependent hydrolase (beta-lactamase superfamily II)